MVENKCLICKYYNKKNNLCNTDELRKDFKISKYMPISNRLFGWDENLKCAYYTKNKFGGTRNEIN